MKKLFSLLLILCLLLVVCPSGAFAKTGVGSGDDLVTGDFGTGFRYVYNKYHAVLFVHGEGALETGDPEPWDAYKGEIRRIVLDEGITSVPAGAFSGCGKLASVVFPRSLETVEEGAFADCGSVSYAMSTGSRSALSKMLKEAGIDAFRAAQVTRVSAKSLAREISNLESDHFLLDFYNFNPDKYTAEELAEMLE